MKNKNSYTLLIRLESIMVAILSVIMIVVLISNVVEIAKNKTSNTNNTNKLTSDTQIAKKEETATKEKNINEKTNANSFIPLKVGNIETMQNGALICVNDYKISISQKLIDIGYDLKNENNVLTIKSKDGSYEANIIQLTDNYIMPTKEEQAAFDESPEYIAWDNETYDANDKEKKEEYFKRYDTISINYYKSLGYTVENTPDFTLTEEEIYNLLKDYMPNNEPAGGGSNKLKKGYEYYTRYDWGKRTLYTIPKHMKDGLFGEADSDFSVALYIIEHYNSSSKSIDTDLWVF